ncbi:patatin-like phospholipase family protein [Patulibacter sp. NPDC049589]|uniref:patatin-like phospholipase family protein n=1 Tax=Patulibacter sp. NPDC049589 TaxID=3154731 RepID=UPI00343BB88D
MQRALVLGAGGLAAIAWETGLLAGLLRAGVDLTDADVVVGTSAGSTVAAQLGGPRDLEELVAGQLDPVTSELTPDRDPARIAERAAVWATLAEGGDPLAARRRMGEIALATPTVDESVRRAVIATRLAGVEWPERPLLVPAVDALTAEPVVFDRDCGVDLVDAVAASCAVPGMWPPVTIGDRRYVDGGVRSGTNADLVLGVPLAVVLQVGDARPDDEGAVDALGDATGGTSFVLLRPDAAFFAARGEDPLDPAVRPGCVRAGLAQAARIADDVGARWTTPAAAARR